MSWFYVLVLARFLQSQNCSEWTKCIINMDKRGDVMSHLDCTVYAACVSKERSLQTVHFQLRHTVHLTQGNKHAQASTYSDIPAWRVERAGEGVEWGGQGSDSLLLQRARGTTTHTHPLPWTHAHTHTHTQGAHRQPRSRFIKLICNQDIGIPPTHSHTSRNVPQALNKMDIWEHTVDGEIWRQL